MALGEIARLVGGKKAVDPDQLEVPLRCRRIEVSLDRGRCAGIHIDQVKRKRRVFVEVVEGALRLAETLARHNHEGDARILDSLHAGLPRGVLSGVWPKGQSCGGS